MSGTKQTNNTQFKNPSRIIGIQFGMLSPEEIRKGVVEVVSKDTYINNKEVPGGLFDPRMGVLGHGSVCPTDGLTYINTPGYFGYIELARPVFFIQHIKDIMSILKCVCFKCSKLLISKEDHKHVINMKASDRWSYVYKKCSGISRCGEATELGCGCKQPDKIKLEEMATIIAIWDNLEKTEGVTAEEKLAIIASGKSQFTMRFTAEIVLKIFKRISDEDVNFMGFSPIWSRPDWMVCQVLPVAPPSVRPSVKQDANQRSEDDLTHIYGHIIKTNKDLEERISNNAAPHVIDGLTKVLQYFVAMIANNKVKGAVPMAQRSGRPLQCITDRLNSKNGRIRGNLMGKRVDFSARSVITGDPNLSAKQLGVPKKVAMNLTKPVVVNDRNRNFLTKLVQNGPDVYPGAKNLEKKNGDTISLRYRDRMSIRLENGDVVHRHMMDGDPVLFNRQPSLHRMSMMCHIAKIMDKGDTFRMNVCDTKPYNADFDGDEMNMHMPQNVLSETELRHLAAIPYQIISPSSNAPIIGIYQDSMLGTYRFTRPDIEFSPREAMNILMGFSRVDVASLAGKKKITSFDILSQITPPLTLKTKTKQYDDKADDYATSNNVLEILNGKYVRGQMIASTVKSVLNRVCNDFGHLACSDYIDDLQQVITEYMKTSAYSVGVSDLISDKRTTDEILQVIAAKKAEVQQLTDKIHLGIFENKTGNANSVEYENQVKGILNKATDQTGTIAKKSLDANNRFLIMVASGSKGNMVNISQMISCLGQQSVDGKRVPYGFDNRTLPHFSKYDDSPGARGFVENSYISGLTAPELFFHAMGGRMGLIDTAVKTSQTGYIQRRLVKGLEDLKVEYDMTVRNNMGKIVQFSYGEDGAETTRIENQSIPIVGMSVEQIYMHYDIVGMNEGDHELIKIYTKGAATRIRKQREETQALCKKYIDYMIDVRDELVENVFKFKNEDSVKTPVAFHHLIMNAHGQFGLTGNSTVDITPLEAFHMIEAKFETLKLSSFSKPTKMFEILYFYYLSPKDLLVNKRFNKKMLEILLESIHLNFKKSIVSPGEMVGVIAGQSIGEPTTQMSLTRNECIKIVKMVDGKPRMMSVKIGDFCDQIIDENPSMTFGTGHENSVETILGEDHEYYIMGVNANETTQWSKISHVSRHPVNGELMRIKTKSGRTVETTTSHSHLVRRDNKVQAIVGKDMKVSMRVPVSKNIDNTFVNDKIQISGKDYELNRLFGWFIGAYLAEGSINYNTICITNISDVFKQNTIAFAELFGKTCKIYEKESEYGHTTDIKFTCAELADFLKITCGNGSYVKCVPDFAFVAPMEFKSSMIQSYMDGDGNIKCDSGHHMIRVCSRSHQLIKDFALIINYFGIFGSISTTFTKSDDLHHLSISAKYAGLYKLHIGSSLDYKMDSLNRLVEYENRDNAHNLSDEIDKINGLGDIIAHCGKTLKLENHSAFYGRWANKESIGRRTLQKYIGVFENNVNANLIGDQLTILKQAASSDVVWDEIVEITILKGTNEFVYDFTVPSNQTFLTDYGLYVHNTLNTFHLAGVASKSNVTRGVPRIEEILRLTRNPDKPSVTIYMKPQDQHDKDKATNYCNMIQYTKLIDVVKSVEICFDPNDRATKIHSDAALIDQFYLFDELAQECNETEEGGLMAQQQQRSKWVVRMEIDAESLLEKNITMDDIHFAISTVHGNEVSCIYSDMNSSNLVFRIRINASVLNRNKKKVSTNAYSEALDQSDEIYLLKNFQDTVINNIVLRGVNKIVNVNPRVVKDMVVKEDGKYSRKEAWVLDTTGSNLIDVFGVDFIDFTRTYSNDIREMYDVLGIEAARQNILNEIVDVMEASDAYVNYHHLSILCDRMTVSKDLVPIYRSGILNDDIGPISKSTYEMHTEMFLEASRHGEFDQMRGVSANVMCGQQGYYGTNSFSLLLDMEAVMNMETRDMDRKDVNDRIEELFGNVGKADECSLGRIRIDNNVHNLQVNASGACGDDGYELF
jgi:DNA-directed RNA polymerase II subunit RPB1